MNGLDASCIADGSVTDTEFKYINSLTSNAQSQIDSNTALINTNISNIASKADQIGLTDSTADRKNKVYAGPINDTTVSPSFRLLDESDIPDLVASKIKSGTISSDGKLTIGGDTEGIGLNVTKDAIFDEGLAVSGITSLATTSGIVNISKEGFMTTIAGKLTTGQEVTFDSTLDVTGLTTMGSVVINNGLQVKNGETSGGFIELYESSGNRSNKITILCPTDLSSDLSLTLPVDSGNSNQVLSTNGSGVLSWVNQTEPTSNINDLTDVNITSVSDGQVLKYDSATSKWINDTDATGGGGGGGGISFDGSTSDGMLTYKDSDEATVESKITFTDGGPNTSRLKVNSYINVAGNAANDG